ncbi:hypothetical protein MJ575_20365 [Klebsiella pneumoniae]|nr:hypothetical protein MJ575_20365 [Klebsiella pneumoniae]
MLFGDAVLARRKCGVELALKMTKYPETAVIAAMGDNKKDSQRCPLPSKRYR